MNVFDIWFQRCRFQSFTLPNKRNERNPLRFLFFLLLLRRRLEIKYPLEKKTRSGERRKKKKDKSTRSASRRICDVCRSPTKQDFNVCARGKGRRRKKTETSLHTFYRLLFTYSQGLYSMELGEERKKNKNKKKRERERERVKEKEKKKERNGKERTMKYERRHRRQRGK